MNFSYYNSTQDKKKLYDISLDEYINKIKSGGLHEDFIHKARAFKQANNDYSYKQIKSNAPAITGSCIIRAGAEDKSQSNIDKLNGLILLDIDAKDQVQEIDWERVKIDPYLLILHKSFGGDGYVIFVKTSCKKPEQYKYYYNALTDYFYNAYGIISDPSCKNPNRLRYISYDPELFKKDAINWTGKETPKKESIKKSYYFSGGSIIENLIQEITSRGINIADDYDQYLKIGFAFADEFGENGRNYFHSISQQSDKYDYDKADKQYSYITKSSSRGITIASFFHYVKDAGIPIYTPRVKEIINQTTNAKRNGVLSPQSVQEQIKVTTNEEPTNEELKIITTLLNDSADYSKSANEELSDTQILENFIIDNYELCLNDMTKVVEHSNGKKLTDRDKNTMYLTAKKIFDFTVYKGDVDAIINSEAIPSYNPINEFFSETPKEKLNGYIDSFIECIDTDKPEFAKKFFKKWLVSGVHNWTRGEFNTQVSPLTLVLCGSQHGTGKTSFFRQILPKELKKYYIESKLKGDDDSLLLMNSSMLLLDDEFGGKAFKENKAFKELSDKNIITVRRKYATLSEDFRRLTLLAGTTNEIEVLKDPTGNRRIIPINVKAINLEKLSNIDTKFMIWEAKQLLDEGFEWVVRTQEDMDEILKNSGQNVDESAEVELINEVFSIDPVDGWINCVMSKAEMLGLISEEKPFYKFTKHSFNDWALKNKAVYNSHHCPRLKKGKKGYKLFRNPLNETPINKLINNQKEDEDMPF